MSGRLPTSTTDLRLMTKTARLVLSRPTYAVVAVVASVVAVTGFAVSQNLSLVGNSVVGGSLPLTNRLVILSEIYPFVGGFYGAPAASAMVVVSALTGVNIAMVTYHFREHDISTSGSAGSLFGVALGLLGAGCAACGSALLLGVLSLFGASGLVLVLPLDGLEISLAAVVALLLSTYWLADGMRGGEVAGCPIDV